MKNITSTQELENKMIRYKDLAPIPVRENSDPIVPINPAEFPFGYMPEMSDMERTLGKTIFVRKAVNDRLLKAQMNLQAKAPYLSLFITYGYRSIEVQTLRFIQLFNDIDLPYFENPADLYEEMHRYVAVPSVAGHTTGGAVDIKIKDISTDKFIDFGSKQYDFTSKDCYVFSPSVSRIAMKNRILLRQIMVDTGFAPFDGEWWHFSYGDKEWAFYYNKPNAIYEQKRLDAIPVNKIV